MFLEVFPTGMIQANCILVGDEEASALAVIDPGAEGERIAERVEKSGLQVQMILHTHGHMDHAGGTAELKAMPGFDVPVGLHPDEAELYRHLEMQGRMMGFDTEAPPEPDLWFEHGQRLKLGALELEIRHTPGHSPGSVCFLLHGAPHPTVIVGDVLFAGSIGRTDLWGGSFPVLERSIQEQLYTLPDETVVISGHGPNTTIGEEKRTNAFVRG